MSSGSFVSAPDLLEELRALGVRLTIDGKDLRCAAPPGVLAPELVSRIRSCKPELIELLAHVEESNGLAVDGFDSPIRPLDRVSDSPLSPAQQRLWFMDALRPGTSFLNVVNAFEVRGHLDLDVLRLAITEIVQRHEALRTTVVTGENGPRQVVHSSSNVELEVVDRSKRSGVRSVEDVRKFLTARLSRPLSAETGSLLRVGVVKQGAGRHVFWLVASHLVWDAWSSEVFLTELATLYAAFASGKSSPLPPLPVQYGDYVEWLRSTRGQRGSALDLAYWVGKLEGAPTTLELPVDHPRPPAMTYRGGSVPLTVSPEVTRRLRELARAQGCTLHVVLVAAIKVALLRYTGQRDITLGAPIAGRVRPETERLIGMFANTVVLRTRLDEEWTLAELLRAVKDTCVEAYDHQHVPFEPLVETLSIPRDRSRTPLYQVLFGFRPKRAVPIEVKGLTFRPVVLDAGNSVTDLAFFLSDEGDVISGSLEYSRDLFEEGTVAKMATLVKELLSEFTRGPGTTTKVSEFDPDKAQRAAIAAWNSGEVHVGRDAVLHGLFAKQALSTPDAVAVRFENESVTYRELSRRVNKLARRLLALGLESDQCVGICMHRSTDMVVAMLAVLTAGGGYLPLDPSYPADRLAYVLEDSGARWVVCERSTRAIVASVGISELVVDAERDVIAGQSDAPIATRVSANQLAYAIYTSGSTGNPKGVLVEHRNAVAFIEAMASRVDLPPGGVWLAGTSISFDISVLEILGSLTRGLTVVLLGDQRLGAVADPEFGLASLIVRHRVTHFQCTPSQATLLLEEPASRAAFRRLRQILVGGEALSEQLALQLLEIVAGRVYNVYGPTEATVWSSVHEVREVSGAVPIGRPIPGTRFYILDAAGRMRPIGAPGELFIGGAGVARGYQGRPDLTKERFLPDPFVPGARMYKTGDLARWNSFGEAEFLGRNDHQVKIRGYRIELGEIESVLQRHASVKEAVVTTYTDGATATALVAYVVSASAEPTSVDELRVHLKAHVPAYMIPSAFVELPTFPLTPNGKIDRKALPTPVKERGVGPSSRRVEAHDDVERRMLDVWQHSLGLLNIGIEDDFFELGGHSILGVRLLSRVHHEFGVSLSLSVLFEAPNVAAMAARIRSQLRIPRPEGVPALADAADVADWTTVVPIQTLGSLPPLFCVAGRGGNPMNLVHVARYLGKDQPFYGLQHRGVDGKLEPHETVEDMAREFVAHMRRVQPRGPYQLSGFSGGGTAALEMAAQLRAAGETVSVLMLLESTSPELRQWSVFERVGYHAGRLKDEGTPYVVSALFNALLRRGESLRLQMCSQAAKAFPYEFRNEAVEYAWTQMEGRYRPKPYPGSVYLLRSLERDTLVFDPYNGWRPVILGEVVVVDVEGGHTSFVSEPHAKSTAERIAEVLATARGPGSGVRQLIAAGKPNSDPEHVEVSTRQ